MFRMDEKKNDPALCCPQKTNCEFKATNNLRGKERKNIQTVPQRELKWLYQYQRKQILRQKSLLEPKNIYIIMIKGLIGHEDITINTYAPKNRALKYMK